MRVFWPGCGGKLRLCGRSGWSNDLLGMRAGSKNRTWCLGIRPCGREFESSIKVGQTGVCPVDFCNADKLLGFGMVGLEIEVVGGCDWFRLW